MTSTTTPDSPALPRPPLVAASQLVFGFALVFLALRIAGLDILPDVVGWLLVAVGLRSLRSKLPFSHWSIPVAALAALLSLADLVRTTERAAFVDGLVTLYQAVTIVGVVLVCWSIATAAKTRDETALARRFRTLAWANALPSLILYVLAALLPTTQQGVTATAGSSGATFVALLAIVSLGVSVWTLFALWGLRRWSALYDTPDTAPS